MIKLSGTLFIRVIHGRNGSFSVGRLVTEIGEFAVKDTLLDQYDEGRYEGEFGVTRIYPTHYLAGGRLVVEVRAILATLALAAIDELPADQVPSNLTEPDPLDQEQEARSVNRPGLESAGNLAQTSPGLDTVDREFAGDQPESPVDSVAADEALFGLLWPLSATVKLDTTVDRALFRQQKERLKALGYRFQPVGQVWLLAE